MVQVPRTSTVIRSDINLSSNEREKTSGQLCVDLKDPTISSPRGDLTGVGVQVLNSGVNCSRFINTSSRSSSSERFDRESPILVVPSSVVLCPVVAPWSCSCSIILRLLSGTPTLIVIHHHPTEVIPPKHPKFIRLRFFNDWSTPSNSVSPRWSLHTTHPTSPSTLAKDHLVPIGVPIAVLLIYEQPSSDPKQSLISPQRLQQALALLMDEYPHLTGRFQMNEDDNTLEITSLNTGAELLIASCDKRLDEFPVPGSHQPGRIFTLPGAGTELCPPLLGDLASLFHGAILKIQHTSFKCGSVALGIQISHSVCDAGGVVQLIRHLAQLYRATLHADHNNDLEPILPKAPRITSYLAQAIDKRMNPQERMAALQYQPDLFHIDESVDSKGDIEAKGSSFDFISHSFPPSRSPNIGRFLRFSSAELKSLKELAIDPNENVTPKSWISTFDALSAHLYQRVYRARLKLRAHDPTVDELTRPDIMIAVGLRNRIGPDVFPSGYFPNATFNTHITLPHELLAHGPLWKVAKALHELTHQSSVTSKEEVIKTLKWIEAQPNKRKIKPKFQYGNGSFIISQWNKFDAYSGTDFELSPVLISPPCLPTMPIDGVALFLQADEHGPDADFGAIDVSLALSEPVWEFF
ncbi:hypothetical protein CROQUDRAFT_90924 [Cronartium quercuum f. sp. fusiforme G11]|uniref:Transferase n=1 Tax=Cronartium quercuum f. sp. fusiforme G11 TaxID=708437 RepID=A0A9P6NPR9_9BASI|nr:hypothetical protein CROQUDRAFT_90924 [Cronartium quercuum f. sp. fusiforme G11]